MCTLSREARDEVCHSVNAALADGKPFTGYDIYRRLEDSSRDSRDVSAFVRELFNDGQMPGWASTQVIPKSGPVLYFKVTPSMAAHKVKTEILAKLKG